jgi:hypothetical protein
MKVLIGSAFLLALAIPMHAVELAFDLEPRFGAMFVQVQVNGRTATFLVDTGAASTYVQADLAGINPRLLQTSRFKPNGGFEAYTVRKVADVSLGHGRWRRSMQVGACDLAELSSRYGRRVDGILGQDVLRRFRRVTIDFGAKTLLLAE